MTDWNPYEAHTCPDCGVREGQMHKPGCDMEHCPFCGGQLISCGCAYKMLGIDVSPGTDAWEHGLTDEQARYWTAMLETQERVPYMTYPWVCMRGGEVWPDAFMVPDEEWARYVPKAERRGILCRKCYDWIVEVQGGRVD